MDLKKFFNYTRAHIVDGGKLTTSQVDGISEILDACEKFQVTDKRHIASILATPMIETGGTYVPIVESLNYTVEALRAKFPNRITAAQASKYGRKSGQVANQQTIANIIYGGDWGKENLGNIEYGDGWLYRGRGEVQLTGRRLYALAGKLIGKDLLKNPDLACDLTDACKILVVGERDGIFTGLKLSNYFNDKTTDWKHARRIVNGLDRADDLAHDSQLYYRALLAA